MHPRPSPLPKTRHPCSGSRGRGGGQPVVIGRVVPALVPLLLPRITAAALTAGAASSLAAADGRARLVSACSVLRRSSLAVLPLSRPGSGGGDGSWANGGGAAGGGRGAQQKRAVAA